MSWAGLFLNGAFQIFVLLLVDFTRGETPVQNIDSIPIPASVWEISPTPGKIINCQADYDDKKQRSDAKERHAPSDVSVPIVHHGVSSLYAPALAQLLFSDDYSSVQLIRVYAQFVVYALILGKLAFDEMTAPHRAVLARCGRSVLKSTSEILRGPARLGQIQMSKSGKPGFDAGEGLR